MIRLATLALLASVLLITGCATTGKTCTQYRDVEVAQRYCEKMAPQTCRTYCDAYGCRQNCYGGGYCQSWGTRMVTSRECVSFVCQEGYTRVGDECLTAGQIAARAARAQEEEAAALRNLPSTPEGLFQLADSYSHDLPNKRYAVRKDLRKAVQTFGEACDQGHGLACWRAALLYRNGSGVLSQEPDRWTQFFRYAEKSCASVWDDAGVFGMDPCSLVADIYERSSGLYGGRTDGDYYAEKILEETPGLVPKNVNKAMALRDKSCAAGRVSSCVRLARAYMEGENGLRQSRDQAIAYAQKARAADMKAGQKLSYWRPNIFVSDLYRDLNMDM
jgi:TPR repeat protein